MIFSVIKKQSFFPKSFQTIAKSRYTSKSCYTMICIWCKLEESHCDIQLHFSVQGSSWAKEEPSSSRAYKREQTLPRDLWPRCVVSACVPHLPPKQANCLHPQQWAQEGHQERHFDRGQGGSRWWARWGKWGKSKNIRAIYFYCV